jgi:hypothetical protein
MQADVHDQLTLPVGGPTLDHTEWGKDPSLEPGFDPVLDQIQYLAENDLTSLMELHDFIKAPHASPGLVPPPRMDVHRGERHHAAGPRA